MKNENEEKVELKSGFGDSWMENLTISANGVLDKVWSVSIKVLGFTIIIAAMFILA